MSIGQLLIDRPDIAAMTDQDAAVAINAKTVPIRKSVPIDAFIAELYEIGVAVPALQAAKDTTHPAHAVATAVVGSLLDLKALGISSVRLESPQTIELLDAFEAAGLITAAQRTTVDALADDTTSLAAQYGLGRVLSRNVAGAR